MKCLQCGKELIPDEIAMYKKLVSRRASEFMCYSCIAKQFQVTEELIREKAEYFKKTGCRLFG